ncbi:hypothetical protein CEXT_217741 [Caerostris extrusa]|uniref:Uncharacterized protein n=1 Tax=Caerostris extrusa TaxID=172846 RepID=A0AAV4S8D7_CAEEX|nr:hypothetical protein CEXT_217741 [Caerostris extrusa]
MGGGGSHWPRDRFLSPSPPVSKRERSNSIERNKIHACQNSNMKGSRTDFAVESEFSICDSSRETGRCRWRSKSIRAA